MKPGLLKGVIYATPPAVALWALIYIIVRAFV